TLAAWVKRCGLRDVRVVDVSATTCQEQRRTDWMRFESLTDYLDPNDPARTVEGYPAPLRATLIATRA
ncbi:MAG: tRNA 5-methoxyuridine(34)/uridine 5-oxyacetic acid(34) synthase CmoB, partial [Candidatus Sedimenticola endophacoides]